MSRAWPLAWCLVWVVLASITPARAQSNVEVAAALSDDTVEVNDAVSLELRVTYGEGAVPSRPILVLPDTFTVIGPHIFRSKFRMGGIRGSAVKQVFSARWQLVPSQTGTFDIEAPTVTFEGRQLKANPLKLTVVEEGKNAQKKRQGFGGFGSFFSGPQSSLDFDLRGFFPAERPDLTPTGEELSLPRAPDPHIFLRIIPDKTTAVVGEQITLSYWAYSRGMVLRHGQPREAPLVDFARAELDPPRGVDVRTRVGGQLWTAQLFQNVAIFPLRPGKLETGRVELDVVLPGLGRREIVRRSNNVVIDVTEPPKEGRPPGYELGDVGRFKLAATVSPRETVAGETVSVMVKVTGFGQLPHDLVVPKRQGVEWLEPERREAIESHDGRIGGWRTFGYAVRFTEPGTHDLGVIELPHYDPTKNEYEIARAELGSIRVAAKAGASTPAGAEGGEPEEPLATLGGPRTSLGAFEPRGNDGLDPRLVWPLALAPPVAVLGGGALVRALAGMRRRRRRRRDDPAVLARVALAEAKGAVDLKDAAAATERAMHLALEARTGIKARGIMLSQLAPSLRDRGLDESLADEAVALLEILGTVRFAPSEEAGEDLRKRATAFVKQLLPS